MSGEQLRQRQETRRLEQTLQSAQEQVQAADLEHQSDLRQMHAIAHKLTTLRERPSSNCLNKGRPSASCGTRHNRLPSYKRWWSGSLDQHRQAPIDRCPTIRSRLHPRRPKATGTQAPRRPGHPATTYRSIAASRPPHQAALYSLALLRQRLPSAGNPSRLICSGGDRVPLFLGGQHPPVPIGIPVQAVAGANRRKPFRISPKKPSASSPSICTCFIK